MLAVVNPDISFERFDREYSGPYIYDRDLRNEGDGIVRVDHGDGAFTVECGHTTWTRPTPGRSRRSFPGGPTASRSTRPADPRSTE